MTASDNQPHPYRNEQQRIAELEAFAERLVKSEQKYRMIVEHANNSRLETTPNASGHPSANRLTWERF